MFSDILLQAEKTNKEAAEALKYAQKLFLAGEYTPLELIELTKYVKEVYLEG